MTQKSIALSLALISVLLPSCGVSNNNSKLDGHYEESTASKFAQATGAQRATAEWEDSQGVVISYPLIESMKKYDMAAAIAATSIDKLWITVPPALANSNVRTSSAFSELRQALGSNISKVELVTQPGTGLTVWARDWAPQGAVTPRGDVRLLDFNYYSNRQSDDHTARSMESNLGFNRVSVPVYNEGGNFMNTTTGHCMMTTRVTEANSANSAVAGDMVLSNAEIIDYYKASAGCKKVTIFPRIPYEGTGHIDMWAKFMNDDTVIVSEIRDDLPGGDKTVKDYYDARAADIEAMGYRVIRIPSLGITSSPRKSVIYSSYTNSLLVNGEALVPRYLEQNVDKKLVAKYEAEVKAIYQGLGYKFTWINSDDLIAMAGAVHCTTMQIPR
jgi:agmatine/peptidylarginine deiminase